MGIRRFCIVVLCLFTLAGCGKQQADITTEDDRVAEAVAPNHTAQPETEPELKAVYTADNTARLENELYISTENADECVLVARTGGVIKTIGSSVIKSGDSSSPQYSRNSGLNAAVLAMEGGSIELEDTMITSAGNGSGGVFASGSNASVTLRNSSVSTGGVNSPAVSSSADGIAMCDKLAATTQGVDSPGVSAMEHGFVDVRGSEVNTVGQNSPAIYAAGKVRAEGAKFTASGSEGAVIEGTGFFSCIDTDLSGNVGSGVFIYRNGLDKEIQGMAALSMTGGSLSSLDGALIHVTNASARVNLDAVTVDAASSLAIYAAAGNWGTQGRNGGHITLNLRQQTLTGDMVCDSISTLAVNMECNTAYTGIINGNNTALNVDVALDDTSVWDVTGDCYLSSITDSDPTLSNIYDNGNTIYYDKSSPANGWLGGEAKVLQHGGMLKPI